MKDLNAIDTGVIRTAVKDLNDSGLIEKPIRTVGVKRETLIELFTAGVESVNDAEATKLPKTVIELYNTLYADEEEKSEEVEKEEEASKVEPGAEKEEEAEVEEKEEEAEVVIPKKRGRKPSTEPKKEKEPKAPKVPKEKKSKEDLPKSAFGAFLNSQAGKIEEKLVEGATMDEIIAYAAASKMRINNHIRYLEAKKGIKVTKGEDGIFKATK